MLTAERAPRALVVDDDAEVGDLLREVLSQEGFEVAVAHSGAECLELSAMRPPDVLLLDLALPGADGLTTLRRLQDLGQRPVVIVVTGHGSLESARAAMELGVFEYLTKPLALDLVKSVIFEGLSLLRYGGGRTAVVDPDLSHGGPS